MPVFPTSTPGGTKSACLATLEWQELVRQATGAVRNDTVTITGVRLTPEENLPFNGASRVRLCDRGGKVLREVRASGGRRVGKLTEPLSWRRSDGDLLVVWIDDVDLAAFVGEVRVEVATPEEG